MQPTAHRRHTRTNERDATRREHRVHASDDDDAPRRDDDDDGGASDEEGDGHDEEVWCKNCN